MGDAVNNLLLWLYVQRVRVKTLRAYRGGDWRSIPIQENGEDLVEVPQEYAHPFYCKMGISDDTRVFLREHVVDMFMRAREFSRRFGYDLVVFDGWRGVRIQKDLFWYYMKEFTAKKFGADGVFEGFTIGEVEEKFSGLPETLQETMKEANRVFVSWPSSDAASTKSAHNRRIGRCVATR